MVETSGIGLVLASATSVVNVLMDISRKQAVAKNELIGTTFWIRAVAALGFFVVFLWRLHEGHGGVIYDQGPLFGIASLGLPSIVTYLLYVLIDTALVGLGLFFYFRALQLSDLSLCVPFLAFTPVFLIPAGYFMLHELPSLGSILGVILVVTGSLVMNQESFRYGLFGPVKAIFRDRGSRYMMYVALILSITNPIDKKAVLMSDSVTFAFVYGGMLLLIYAGLMAVKRPPLTAALRKAPGWIVMAGTLDALALLLQFTSHRYVDVVVTITLKRAGVILTVLAGWLIFRERHIGNRLLASGVMLSGVVLLYLPMALRVQTTVAVGTLLLLAIILRLRPAIDVGNNLAPAASELPRAVGKTVTAFAGTAARSAFDRRLNPPTVSIPSKWTAANPLRCAFVGCGEVSQQYLRVYRELEWVQVAVCIDTVLERAQSAARLLSPPGKAVPVSARFSAALHADVDVVMISTPNHLHREQAVAALTAGKHVFLQKPIAANFADGQAIVRASLQTNALAGMYMSYFDQPLVHDLRAMAKAGWFGHITQMHARLMHRGGLSWSRQASQGTPSWRGSIKQTGGGAFIQLAVHYMRLFRSIMGEPLVAIHGMASNLNCPGLEGEDSAVALLRFASGAYGTLNLSWCARGEELAVSGTEGSITYVNNQWVTMQSAHSFEGYALRYQAPGTRNYECRPPDANQPQRFNQHCMFLEAIRDGGSPLVSFQDGLEDLAAVVAFYESVRNGAMQTILSSEALLENVV